MNEPVVSTRFPYLPIKLSFEAEPDRSIDIEALVDTGFDGGLIVPAGLVPQAAANGISNWMLADGSRSSAAWYWGWVTLGHFAEPLLTKETMLQDEILVGRQIIDHYRVTFDHGQRVIVEG